MANSARLRALTRTERRVLHLPLSPLPQSSRRTGSSSVDSRLLGSPHQLGSALVDVEDAYGHSAGSWAAARIARFAERSNTPVSRDRYNATMGGL